MSLSDLVLFWNEKAAKLLNFHSNPGHDTRRFAVVQIAIHDTLNCYKKKYDQYCNATSNLTIPAGNWRASAWEAVNSAAAGVLKWAVQDIINYTNNPNYNLAQKVSEIENWYILKKRIDDPNAVLVGNFWANAIIGIRNNDNIDQVKLVSPFPDGTIPRKFRGDYYTFPPPEDKFMVNYSVVKPFVLTKHDQFRRDLSYSDSEQTSMIEEIELMGSKEYVSALPQEQIDKIEYWSPVEQHILWNNFARQIITSRNNLDAWDIARVFALIHTAMADGAIAMFGDLYHFYHWRPITAINLKYNGNPISDPKWIPYKNYDKTPRVPEYPSSFAVLGGATGEILEAIFPRKKNVISGAVDDNAFTKINCGWNFRKSAKESLKLGRNIGNYVLKYKFQRSVPVPV